MGSDPVERLISKWQTATGDSHPFGLSNGQLVELAESAVGALSAPRTWTNRDTLPDDVHNVGDECERTWTRVVRSDGSRGWSCFVLESRFPELVGDVYEIVTAKATRGECTTGSAPGTDLYPCGAIHPTWGVDCDKQPHQVDPNDGATWHHCKRTGSRWYRNPEPTRKTEQTTETDPFEVISGTVVEILDAAGAKLRKLKDTYKGSATKGAGRIADMCDSAAASLRDLTGGNDN
jgi:hypothetical protein